MDIQKKIRIGTRKSQLALFQANFVKDILKAKHPEIHYEIVAMSTTGDNILNVALSKIGEKSLFTKELEVALEKNEVDIVVHSLKDLPTTLPDGMVIGAICKRVNPFDTVVFSKDSVCCNLESLPQGSIIGTSSLRRMAQLRRFFPHLSFESIRGNLHTRLRKLDEDNYYSALILAAAGLERMDLHHRISMVLQPEICMYAVGQGALAVECKQNDLATLELLSEINDMDTAICCAAERAFMKTLEGGCSVPVGVYTKVQENKLMLTGGVFSLDGAKSIVDVSETDVQSFQTIDIENSDQEKEFCGIAIHDNTYRCMQAAMSLGTELAKDFLKKGAEQILTEARTQNATA